LLKALKKAGETHIILDCPVDKIYSVMEQALQVGMLTEYHNYFITSLDFHAVEMETFKHSGANITGLSLIDIENNNYNDVMGTDWAIGVERYSPGGFSIAPDYPYNAAIHNSFQEEAHISTRVLMVIDIFSIFVVILNVDII
jgi:ionotropic kainate glutamate receptor 2